MPHIILKSSLVWAGILLSSFSYAQEVPLGVLPMQFNSSFAGEAESPRISTNIGFRTPTPTNSFLGSNYRSGWGFLTNASYDQFIPAIRSGVGVSVAQSSQATFIPIPADMGLLWP